MGEDWTPSNTMGSMLNSGDDIFTFEALIPEGEWEYKVVLNQNWDQDTYGNGGNFSIYSDGVIPIIFNYDFKQNSTSYSLAESECSPAGDVNSDNNVDVLDVVSMVNVVLGNMDVIPCSDYNEDGNVDVLDIVSVVSLILGN